LDTSLAIGPQKLRVELPDGVRIRCAHALRAETELAFRQQRALADVTVPKVEDYEVVALARA